MFIDMFCKAVVQVGLDPRSLKKPFMKASEVLYKFNWHEFVGISNQIFCTCAKTRINNPVLSAWSNVHIFIFQVFPHLFVPARFHQSVPGARDVKQLLFMALCFTG